jgi:hypothetical protein
VVEKQKMVEINFDLTESVRGNNIQKIKYFAKSEKFYIWHNNRSIQVDLILKSMVKTPDNCYQVINCYLESNTNEKILIEGAEPHQKAPIHRNALQPADNKANPSD